jgi:hypothetical protein
VVTDVRPVYPALQSGFHPIACEQQALSASSPFALHRIKYRVRWSLLRSKQSSSTGTDWISACRIQMTDAIGLDRDIELERL